MARIATEKQETHLSAMHYNLGVTKRVKVIIMQEVWKDVVGYEGLYQVSNFGSVRGLDRYVPHKKFGKKFCKGGLMVKHINNAGYLTVNLSKNNKYKSFDIHRLVAIAFIQIGDPRNMEVNHIDENKKNNNAENLEWVTKSYNNRYGTKVERQASKIRIPILQCDTDGNIIREWDSSTNAEKELAGKVTGAISHCVKGNLKTAYGYVWKYKEAK